MHLRTLSKCFCVHVSASGHPRSQQYAFWHRSFPFKEHYRDYSTINLWSFSSQEKATELLGEDGQSRWIATVCDCESDNEGEELNSPPAVLSSDKPMDLKQGEKASVLKPFPLVTARPKQEPKQQTTTTAPALNSTSSTFLQCFFWGTWSHAC